MSSLETLDVGQANELKLALRRTGWTNEEVKRLCEGNVLADVRNVILGHAEMKVIEHVIDCDADPFVPEGWKVEEHRKGGEFRFDPAQVRLFLSSQQRNGKVIEGRKLRREMVHKPVLNTNVLDYLIAHPRLIPEEWKRDSEGRIRYIFFWGTIYRISDGDSIVRYLYWDGGRWSHYCHCLDSVWNVHNTAALRVVPG